MVISGWNGGRLGNELFQVMHALVYAEATGAREVILPSNSRNLDKLFDLPLKIPIAQNPDLQIRVRCSLQHTGYFFKEHADSFCTGVRRKDYRRVLKLYVKSRMNNATKTMCAAEGSGFPGLTIHLRSGDLVHADHKQGRFMPCSYHDSVIAAGDFKNIRIVTEPDLSHPCLAALHARHRGKNVIVQSKSIQEDACALMNAQNLDLGDSTFGDTLEMMNENVREVCMPKVLGGGANGWFEVGSEEDPMGSLAVCPSDGCIAHRLDGNDRKYSLYHVDGRKELRSLEDKSSFLLSTPVSSLKVSMAYDKTQ